MDLGIVIPTEISQTEKDKYMILLVCGILKTTTTTTEYKQTCLQNRRRVPDVENKLMVTRGGGRRENWETGIKIYTLLYMGFPHGSW